MDHFDHLEKCGTWNLCADLKKHRLARHLYRQRYLVEVFFHNLKRFRAIATRYEKTARNYLAIVHVACAWLWLKEASC